MCFSMLTLPIRYQKYWTYDDQGRVSFKNVSLPTNIFPESTVKVMWQTLSPTDTPQPTHV